MDRLRSKFRGLLELGWTTQKFDAEWFELAWNDGHSLKPNNIHLIRALLANKADGINRFGEHVIQEMFTEEVNNLRERIKIETDFVEPAICETKPLLQIPCALVRQEPVGHGCFHTGVLGTTKPLFRWVYDCGSWTMKTALKDQIDGFAKRLRNAPRRTDVDLLFISHFDADHVSGLEYLLARKRRPLIKVHTVIVPYVAPAIAFSILAKAAVREDCSDELIDAVCFPANYFASRGVKRLIIIRPNEGDDSTAVEGGLSPQPPVRPPSGLRVTDGLSPVFMGPDGKLLRTRRDISNGIDIAEADLGTTCGILAGGAWADWWLIPYAYQWSSNHQKLSDAAKRVIRVDPSNTGFYRRLKKELRTKSGVKRIKSIYDSLNSNGTSLSIYAGPISESSGRFVYGSSQNAKASGWLLTGDAKLKTKSRMSEWRDFFKSMAPTAGHLMLPHHGAAENFNPSLITFAKHARNFATVNSGDFDNQKRPPFKVVSQLAGNLRAVSELAASCIVEISGPWQCNDACWLNKVSGW